ncbi:MAG: MFS transporter [Nitrospirota bacterium]
MSLSPFLLLCTTGFFAIFSSTISKSPVLPLFASRLGADPAGVGFIASVSAFAGVAFSIPAGILSDRLGKKKMLLISSVIFSSAPFLYLYVTKLWQLAIIRFYHGFATAIFMPVAMALVSELFHRERGEKMGWFSTATLAGRFLAPVTGGIIISALAFDAALSYRFVYIVCGIAGVSAFLFAFRIPEPVKVKNKAQPWKETFSSFSDVLTNKDILIASAVEAFILFAYGTFETFLPLYSLKKGLTPYEVGIFLSAQVITLALSKPATGKFSDRHGRQSQIFGGALVGAACIGAFSFFSSFVPLLLLSMAFGLSLSIVTSATSAYIADLSNMESRGSAMGLLGSVMDIGHTAGPLVSGFIAGLWGYPHAFVTASVLLFSAALIFKAAQKWIA